MHPRFEELMRHLDSARADLRAAIESIPEASRSRKPASGGWSPIGVLEHLALAESRITGLLAKKISDAKAAGLGPETDATPILSRLGLERVIDRSVRIEAPPPIQPTQEREFDVVWAALEEARHGLKRALAEGDGLALGEISHPHPVFGLIDGYQWIGFIGSHEARHAAQIREIGASLADG
jgi:hypothetical protein